MPNNVYSIKRLDSLRAAQIIFDKMSYSMVSLELILGFNVQVEWSGLMCRKGNGNMCRQHSSSMSRFNVRKNIYWKYILNKFTGSNYKFNVLVQCGWSIWPTIYNAATSSANPGSFIWPLFRVFIKVAIKLQTLAVL